MLDQSYGKILSVALPLMFGTLIQSVVGVTDGIMVSSLGTVAFDAVGNGGLMYISMFMLCKGIGDGAQIIIARKYGEGNNGQIGSILFGAQFTAVLFGFAILLFLLTCGPWIIREICESTEIASSMTSFIQYRSWGIPFASLHVATAALFIGLGKTGIYMLSAIILAVSNIILDYGLIFGELGLPEMGVGGAALASSISEALACTFLLFYALYSPKFKEFNYNLRHRIKKTELFLLAKLSYPLMLQGILALSTWLVFFAMIEQLGPEKLEASHNIRYMYFLAFVPIFGFGATTRTFVSNLVGQGKRELINKTQIRIAILSLSCMFAIFHGAIFYPQAMIGLVNHNPNISLEVMADSVNILQFVCGSIFLFSLIVVPYSAVSGLGKTKAALLIEVSAIVTYLIATYIFIKILKLDIVMVWSVEYIYFVTMGIISLVMLRYFRNRPV